MHLTRKLRLCWCSYTLSMSLQVHSSQRCACQHGHEVIKYSSILPSFSCVKGPCIVFSYPVVASTIEWYISKFEVLIISSRKWTSGCRVSKQNSTLWSVDLACQMPRDCNQLQWLAEQRLLRVLEREIPSFALTRPDW